MTLGYSIYFGPKTLLNVALVREGTTNVVLHGRVSKKQVYRESCRYLIIQFLQLSAALTCYSNNVHMKGRRAGLALASS
jgi:hypothetical protein